MWRWLKNGRAAMRSRRARDLQRSCHRRLVHCRQLEGRHRAGHRSRLRCSERQAALELGTRRLGPRRPRHVPALRMRGLHFPSIVNTFGFHPYRQPRSGLLRRHPKGDNKWANSVVALRASTGEFVWGFQVVHHDLWDYDVAPQPTLFTWKDGTPAVVVNTKMDTSSYSTALPSAFAARRGAACSEVRDSRRRCFADTTLLDHLL